MDPIDAGRAVARPINSLGSRFMLHPDTYAGAAEHGFSGLDFYFTGRGGALGDVGPEVVIAAFGFMDPGIVEAMWNDGRAVMDPRLAAQLFADSCAAWGRAHFGADLDYARLSELAGRVIVATSPEGLPLFAGWRAMPVPPDPLGAAAHQLNVLRELRGGVHLLAVVGSGIPPLAAVLHAGGARNAAMLGFAEPYPDVSQYGHAMEEAEAITDRLAARSLAELNASERREFTELVVAAYAGLI